MLQRLQRILEVDQLGAQVGRGRGHARKQRFGFGDRFAQLGDLALHRVEHIRKIAQVAAQRGDILADGALAAGVGALRAAELLDALRRGVQAAAQAVERVEHGVKARGDLFVIVLQLVLALGELGDLGELRECGGDHQKGHAAEGEIVAADADGEVTLLAGQTDEQHRAEVADELHLRAGSLEREDVVLIENGHRLERIVIAGILARLLVGDGVDADLDHTGLAGKLLSLHRHAVERVVDGERPRQLLEGLGGLALEVEMVGDAALVEGKDRPSADGLGRKAVRQVDDLVIVAVVRERGRAVGRVAFDHAAVGEVAVVVRHGVVCLVIDRLHAVVHGAGGYAAEQQRRAHGKRRRAAQGLSRVGMVISHG